MAIVKSDIGGNITVSILSSKNFGWEFTFHVSKWCCHVVYGINYICLRLLFLFLTTDLILSCQRLENKYSSDPTKYEHLYTMVQEEVEKKTAKGSSSCTNGLLWLTRFFNLSCLICLFYFQLNRHPHWCTCVYLYFLPSGLWTSLLNCSVICLTIQTGLWVKHVLIHTQKLWRNGMAGSPAPVLRYNIPHFVSHNQHIHGVIMN